MLNKETRPKQRPLHEIIRDGLEQTPERALQLPVGPCWTANRMTFAEQVSFSPCILVARSRNRKCHSRVGRSTSSAPMASSTTPTANVVLRSNRTTVAVGHGCRNYWCLPQGWFRFQSSHTRAYFPRSKDDRYSSVPLLPKYCIQLGRRALTPVNALLLMPGKLRSKGAR